MRLIDADALMDDIAVLLERNHKLIGEWLANCIDDVIEQAPTVVEFKDPITKVMVRGVEFIPVVRCRDCKHYESDGGAMMICNITDMVGDDDDYCSYGVREEGE